MNTLGNRRPAFKRVLCIATEIRNRTGLTAFDLAAELGVAHKTVIRDIDFLKDIGALIYFNAKLNAWVWNVFLPTPWYFGGTIKNPRLGRNA